MCGIAASHRPTAAAAASPTRALDPVRRRVGRTAEARGASVLPAYLGVFLVPGVLVLALVRSFDRTTRAWAGGLAIGTLPGALAVAVVTLAVTA